MLCLAVTVATKEVWSSCNYSDVTKLAVSFAASSAGGVMCILKAEAVTLTVAESFQIAKDNMEKGSSSAERPGTSATAIHQVHAMCTHCDAVTY